MSSIYESFYNYVSNNSTITGALANANNIWPEWVPQHVEAFPAMTYSLSEDEDYPLLNGSRSDAHLAVIQANIWATSYEVAHDVATVLESELIGYRGSFGSHTADLIRKDEGGKVNLPFEQDTGLCGVRISFAIGYY